MSSVAFCSKCGKNELDSAEFTNIDGNTICKDCWLAENNNNNKEK
jgi:hypothetical protein